ncbi:NAD(P)/FAD-dependent oxidoreductase [Prauserella halophila]|uniref:NAD(P)/FAD-dependent oxidoreductase n=1 Tax=Prauserella halophila TaxID=185641 RepID=A0ABN1W1Q7_9PSEU|nr:NAD(P)/FAD-dependent oxidoreductase [Prauserella halophila]MCP2237216.1 putative flavoprotein CzcO associated with the cation diffusion facilitator CzcD [Prauserella halophila]
MTGQATPSTGSAAEQARIVIIGAGFGGIAAAIRLKLAGFDDFVVLDRADQVGGTWQANTYPGAQCDIPSILYSFSFAPKSDWSRLYPLQPEIQQYLATCVEHYEITSHVRLRHEVIDARWHEATQRWHVTTRHGSWHAQVLIGAMGPFSEPAEPELPGLDRFSGAVFHSAAWDHERDLSGKRVAVIGTGASAVQIVPQLQPQAETLTVFQRTPTWILPHPDRPMDGWPQQLFARVPLAQRAVRLGFDLLQEVLVPGLVHQPALLKGMEALGRAHLRRQVNEPRLRAKLQPHYSFGCKRPTFSNTYYPALGAPNADVVTSGITGVDERGITTGDGSHHEFDAIVLATGFRMTDHPMFDRVRGSDERTLSEVWAGDPQAHLGTTISGFPNFFFILGPNSVTYTSQVVTIEAQVEYILSCLRAMDRRDLSSLDVRPEAQRTFVQQMDRGLRRSVWNSGGCSSYYLSRTGRNFVFFPGFSRQFLARTKAVDLDDFHAHRAADHRHRSFPPTGRSS